MRPAYTIDLEHGCIFIKWSGAVTTQDIIAFNRELAQDSDYRSGLNRLVDLRRTKIEAPSDEFKEMVREVISDRDASEGDRRGAMVVGRDLEYGLMRMVGTMTDQTHSVVRPFRRLDEAMAWLGLPETLGHPFKTINQG